MTEPRYDVLAIGNAIVDVIAQSDDAQLAELGLAKGGMTLIDANRAESLYAAMGPGREISGGSAANTLAGLAALGRKCAFIGQVADDQLGAVFAHDVRATGIDYATPMAPADGVPTARCLIFVTPDGERTMNTFLGASQSLPAASIDEALIRDAAILYLEGYLWDPEEARGAMRRAIAVARAAGRTVAFTLSDGFVIARHGADFRALLDEGQIDILFANEGEITALAETADCDSAIETVAPKVPLLVVTRSEQGALAVRGGERAQVPAERVASVIDTTGAGDLFAAGFLAGHGAGESLERCLRMGAIAAAEVISHYGARPEADLRALMAHGLS